MRINFTTIAQNLGVSASTIERRFERLRTSNLITSAAKIQEPDSDVPRWYVAINREVIAAADPALITFPEETPRQGGDHYQCSKCGSKNVSVCTDKTVHCNEPGCGCEKTYYGEFSPIGQNGHKRQKTQKQLAFEGKEPESGGDQAAPSNLPNMLNPDTPPQVAPDRQAAALFVDIADGQPSHIEMQSPQATAKYLTVARPLTEADALAHLRGAITAGVRLRNLDGETRAVGFDGDTPDQWANCKEAALALLNAGWRPILIPSPATGKHAGGGHLWVLFDGHVDAYSALQSIYQITGDLLTPIKEFAGWPRATYGFLAASIATANNRPGSRSIMPSASGYPKMATAWPRRC